MAIFILTLYGISLLYLCLYSLSQLHLTWYYRRSRKDHGTARKSTARPLINPPVVTVQLPVYNERYVIGRLLEAITALDYPADKLEIQVLDDSDDDTTDIIAKFIADNNTFNLHHIRRSDRKGFKAGALAHGLEKARGEFIAIFDADFIPPPDFLHRTLPYFDDAKTGVVQTRWGHLNRQHSLLTELQSFGLDAHFSVEQAGRNRAGSFINFNGTGGVWRRKAIESAGGWTDDTLTEDLDLSYRAQLLGWNFRYLEDFECPAELPVTLNSIKSQQYRWNKGAAETTRKMLGRVFRSNATLLQKVHAFFHLNNSLVFLFLLIASLCSVPLLFVKQYYPQYELFFLAGNFFLLGFISIAFFYWVSSSSQHKSATGFAWKFPLFLSMSMGLAVHNSVAVVEGLLRIRSPFIRTPKFNIIDRTDQPQKGYDLHGRITFVFVLEVLLVLYFSTGIILGIRWEDPGLLFFHFLLVTGYALIVFYTLKPVRHDS